MTEDSKSGGGGLSATKRALLDALFVDEEEAAEAPATTTPTLSSAQRRQWFLHQLDPDDVAYNMAGALELSGELDLALLESSLREVVRRHEVLRARFLEVDGEPTVEVVDAARFILRKEQVPAGEGSEAWLEGAVRREARRPFDLAEAPLLRAAIFRRGPRSHTLVVTMHHIVSDAWSVGVLVNDVVRSYQSSAAAEAQPLRPLAKQFWSYAADELGADEGEHLDYWRERLRGTPPLALANDHPRSQKRRDAGQHVALPLSGATVRALRDFAVGAQATPFMVLTAAWRLALARHTGQDDFALGTPVANRPDDEALALIGFFVNTIALRTDLSGRPSFRDLVARERESMLDAMAHARVPFEEVVDAVDPARDVTRSPIFQSMVVLRNAPPPIELSGLTVDLRHVDVGASQFELSVVFEERHDGTMTGRIEFDASLFDPVRIEAIGQRFLRLLEGALEQPDALAHELPLLGEGERATVLEAWNDTARSYDAELLHRRFAAVARATPEATAVVFEGESISYGDLWERVAHAAAALRHRGVGPGSVVGIHLERSVELIVAIYATLEAGGAYLPLVPSLPAERLAFMAEDADVALVLTADVASCPVGAARPPATLEQLSEVDVSVAASMPTPLPADAAYVIYTSGSTGTPKGVVCTHGGLVNRVHWMQEAFGLGATDRVLHKTPIGFDVSVWELVWPLAWGATMVVAKPGGHGDSHYLLELIEREAVTVCHFVPSMLEAFVEVLDRSRATSLRLVVTSGEALSDDLARRLVQRSGAALHNLYGPTEAAIDVTAAACSAEAIERGVTIGRPIANTQVYVVDRWLQPVPVGVPGELLLGGVQLARGYLGRPGRTATSFVPDPFGKSPGARLYRTGDLVRWRADGYLEYLGRIDHQVKIRGLRIELGEIEARLREALPDRECVVVARETARGDKEIVAYVVAPEAEVDVPALQRRLGVTLPDYMVPRAIVALAAMPRTPNGKVDRRALPAPTVVAAPSRAPRPGLETEIATIFAELLGVGTVGADDDFFELGGHSLLATRVASRLRSRLGRTLPLRSFFETPTVAGLAARLELGGAEGTALALPPLEPARAEEPRIAPGQERLWFLHQLDPASDVYNMVGAVRLRGALDVDRLRDAIGKTVERQSSLRTTFETRDGRAVAVVHPSMPVELERIDLSAEPEAAREARGAELTAEVGRTPFDLERGPLFRCRLLQVGDEDFTLLVAMHHIVSDGWSLEVFTRDVSRAYTGESLRPLRVDFGDYAAWQRRWIESGALDPQLDYWRETLQGVSSLELPTDRPRPPTQTFAGAEVPVEIPLDLARRVQTFATEHDVTTFMVVLGALSVMLSRYARQSDVTIGTPTANRTHDEVEDLVGFFLNMLVMRVDLGGEPTFEGLLEQVREVALGAFEHQNIPFERLVAELDHDRDPSRSPLFQAMLILNNTPRADLTLGDVKGTQVYVPAAVAKFDLTLTLTESPRGFEGHLEYNTDLFDRSSAERMARVYVRLLDRLVREPTTSIRRLPLLSEEEAQKQLERNAESERFLGDHLMHELFAEMVSAHPERPALVHGDDVMTYAELDDLSTRVAAALVARGVGRGSLVAVASSRTPRMIVALLGVLKSGGAYVPLDAGWPLDRLRFMLTESQAKLLLVEGEAAQALSATGVETLPVAEAMETSRGAFTLPAVSPDDLAYVLYTSGSTGRPKGVELTHRNAAALIEWGRAFHDPSEFEGVFFSTSISWDVSIFEIFATLGCGGTGYLAENLLELADHAHRDRITLVCAVPSVMEALLQIAPLPSSVRTVNFVGEYLHRPLVNDLYAHPNLVDVNNLYGPSEDTTYSTGKVAARDSVKAPDIGVALAGSRAYVLDEYLQLVPDGVVGEIYLAGVSLARGYRERPDLTAQKFIPNPFGPPGSRMYGTGDFVRWSTEGVLEYVGRADHQVKLRGFRIELGEIEAVMGSHDAISSCVATVLEVRPGVKQLVAYLVPVDAAVPEPDLRSFARGRLPEYMVPAAFVQLEEFPRVPNGKVDRRALPMPQLDGAEEGAPHAEPESEAERAIAQVWRDVLRVERVGLDDSFFALGGDSILSIQVVSRARGAGWAVSPRDVFQHATLRELAAVARPAKAQAEQGLVTGTLTLAPAQRWLLAQRQPAVSHYNQALLLEWTEPIEPAVLRRALTTLVEHHDLLRARFLRGEVDWEAYISDRPDFAWDAIDVADGERLESHLDALHRQLDPGRVVFGAASLALPDGSRRLWLGAHHLVVDAVSWRVILEDLWTCCAALAAEEDAALPEKTTSFKRWAELLREHAGSDRAEGELPFWRRQLEGLQPLRCDVNDGEDLIEAEERVVVEIDAGTTTKLYEEVVGGAMATSAEAVLVAAIGSALARWQGVDVVGIDLEGHGREPLFEGEDVTRTVGWFTAIYPVRLSFAGAVEASDALAAAKEALDAVPRHGVGFGVLRTMGRPEVRAQLGGRGPEVVLNYLGHLDQAIPAGASFRPAVEGAGAARSPETRRAHGIEVLAFVREGVLRIELAFNPRRHHRASIEGVADHARELIEALTGHAAEELDGVLDQLELDDF